MGIKNTLKSRLFTALAALVAGALIILAVRFFSYSPERIHYHANFSVYINGQREQFKDAFYYTEESGACAENEHMMPKERAHMHDGVSSVVHVEDHAVTWGQFFQNIGWVVDNKLIESPSQLYLADAEHPIHYILNGQSKDYISNIVINDRDRLLVDYGATSDSALQAEYKSVPATAAKYDTQQDPASCSGSEPVTTKERFQHMF